MSSLLRRCLLSVCVGLLTIVHAFAQDADPAQIHYRRILAPVDELTTLRLNGFRVLRNEDFEHLWGTYQGWLSDREAAKNVPPLRVFSIARLDNDTLVSDQMVLEILGNQTEDRIDRLGPLSMAIQAPRPLDLDRASSNEASKLFVAPEFTADGTLRAPLERGKALRFSWSQRGEVIQPGVDIRFALELPPLVQGNLMLQLPAGWSVEGCSLPSMRLTDPHRIPIEFSPYTGASISPSTSSSITAPTPATSTVPSPATLTAPAATTSKPPQPTTTASAPYAAAQSSSANNPTASTSSTATSSVASNNTWAIDLGGAMRVEFHLVNEEITRNTDIIPVATQQRRDIEIIAEGIESTIQWTFEKPLSPGRILEVELHPSYRVRRVEWENETIPWQPFADGIRIPLPPAKSGSQLKLHCVQSLAAAAIHAPELADRVRATRLGSGANESPADRANSRAHPRAELRWLEIPEVVLRGSSVVRYTGSLSVDEQWRVESVQVPETVRLTSQPNARPDNTPQWDFDYVEPCAIQTAIVPSLSTQEIRVANYLQLEPGKLEASFRVRVDFASIPFSAWSFRIRPDWSLDSIIDLESAAPLEYDVRREDNQQLISVHLDAEAIDQTLLFEVRCHKSWNANSQGAWIIESQNLIDFDSPVVSVDWIVEPSEDFRWVSSPTAVRARQTLQSLSDWKVAGLALGPASEVFHTQNGKIPELHFRPKQSDLTATMAVGVIKDIDGILVRYRIRLEPLAGNLQRFRIAGLTLLPEDTQWFRSLGDSKQPFTFSTVSYTSKDENRPSNAIWEGTFETPESQPIELIGEVAFKGDDWSMIDLPYVPEAARQQATIAFEDEIEYQFSRDQILFSQVTDSASPTSPLGRPATVFRYEPGRKFFVQARPGRQATTTPYILEQRIDHFVVDDGSVLHRIQWLMQRHGATALRINVPSDWEMIGVQSEGTDVSIRSVLSEPARTQWEARGFEQAVELDQVEWRFRSLSTVNHYERTFQAAVSTAEYPISSVMHRLWLPEGLHARLPVGSSAGARDEIFPLDVKRWWQGFLSPNLAYANNHVSNLASIHDGSRATADRVESAAWSATTMGRWRSWDLPSTSTVNAAENLAGQIAGGEAMVRIPITVVAASTDGAMRGSLLLIMAVVGFWLAIARPSWIVALPFVYLLATFILANHAHAHLQTSVIGIVLGYVFNRTACLARLLPKRVTPAETPSQPTFTRLFRVGGLLLVVVGTLAWCQVFAQDALNGTDDTVSVSESGGTIYPLIVPIRPDGSQAGEYIYAPVNMIQQLETIAERRKAQSEGDLKVLAVNYRLGITNNNNLRRMPVDRLTITWTLESNQLDLEFSFPLNPAEARLNRFVVNDAEIPLSRLSRSDGMVQWHVNQVGPITVRAEIQPILTELENGDVQFRLGIAPMPHAILEWPSSTLHTIQVDSVGQIKTAAANRMSAALGPIDRINVRWQPIKPIEPTQVDIATSLIFTERNVMAVSRVELRNVRPEYRAFEFVCDDHWQAIGNDLTSARLTEIPAGNAAGLQRFRLDLLEGSYTAPNNRITVEVIWRLDDRASTEVALPIREIIGAKTQTRTVARTTVGRSEWSLSSAENWEYVAWKPHTRWPDKSISQPLSGWKMPEQAAIPRLRRNLPSVPPVVHAQLELMYEPDLGHITFEANWEDTAYSQSSRTLSVPANMDIQSIEVNGKNASFVEDRLSAKHASRRHIQVFLDRNGPGFESLMVSGVVPVEQIAWTEIPIITILEDDLATYNFFVSKAIEVEVDLPEPLPDWLQTFEVSDPDQYANRQFTFTNVIAGQIDVSTPHDNWQWRARPRPRTGKLTGRIVTKLIRSTGAYSLDIRARLSRPDAHVGTLILELPTAVRDLLISDCPAEKGQSLEAGKSLLYIEPKTYEQGEIGFQLSTSRDSNIDITSGVPQVRILDADWVQNILVVPPQIDGQDVQLHMSGVRQLDSEEISDIVTPWVDLSNSLVFEATSYRPTLQFVSNRSSKHSNAKLPTALHRIAWDRSTHITSTSVFWLIPGERATATIRLPRGFRLCSLVRANHLLPIPDPLKEIIEIDLPGGDIPVELIVVGQRGIPADSAPPSALDVPYIEAVEADRTFVHIDRNWFGEEWDVDSRAALNTLSAIAWRQQIDDQMQLLDVSTRPTDTSVENDRTSGFDQWSRSIATMSEVGSDFSNGSSSAGTSSDAVNGSLDPNILKADHPTQAWLWRKMLQTSEENSRLLVANGSIHSITLRRANFFETPFGKGIFLASALLATVVFFWLIRYASKKNWQMKPWHHWAWMGLVVMVFLPSVLYSIFWFIAALLSAYQERVHRLVNRTQHV